MEKDLAMENANSKMEASSKETGRMVSLVEKEICIGLMAASISGIGTKTNYTVTENSSTIMDTIKVFSRMIKSMVMVLTLGPMDKVMMESGSTVTNMAMANILVKRKRRGRAYGRMARG